MEIDIFLPKRDKVATSYQMIINKFSTTLTFILYGSFLMGRDNIKGAIFRKKRGCSGRPYNSAYVLSVPSRIEKCMPLCDDRL